MLERGIPSKRTFIVFSVRDRVPVFEGRAPPGQGECPRSQTRDSDLRGLLGPISLLRISLLRLLDSEILGDSQWAWEFHPSFIVKTML